MLIINKVNISLFSFKNFEKIIFNEFICQIKIKII